MILKKPILYVLILLSAICATNVYSATYDIKNNHSDNVKVMGPLSSKIFDLGYSENDGKKIIEKSFDVIDVKKNSDGNYDMRLHYEKPLYIDNDMVKKMNVGDIVNIELSKNDIDDRLKKILSFEVVDKFLYKKVDTDDNVNNNIFGEGVDFDNIYMYKLVEVGGMTSRYYYVPCLDNEKYDELYYEDKKDGYRIECDYLVSVDKDVVLDVEKRPIVKDVLDLLNHNLNIDKIEFTNDKITYMHIIINNSGEL